MRFNSSVKRETKHKEKGTDPIENLKEAKTQTYVEEENMIRKNTENIPSVPSEDVIFYFSFEIH